LLLPAVAINVLFFVLYAIRVASFSSQLVLAVWVTANAIMLGAIAALRLRRTTGAGQSLTFRIAIRPIPTYLRQNPGSPLILTFIMSLILAAVIYPSNSGFANDIITYTFMLLIVGVALQAVALARSRSPEEH